MKSNDDNIRQVQQLQELNLCHYHYTMYYDDKVGPLKPGFNFYKFLLRKSNMTLQLPIPDTIYIDDISVVRIYTDPQTGIVSYDKPDVNKQELKDKFILRCINNSVGTSIPLLRKAEPLEQRFVGVLKKPVANNSKNVVISNYCDLLTPLAFQSQILNAADHNAGTCVVQRFVKCRGRKPSFFRIFWKATSIGSGAVSGYYVTNRKDGFKVTEDEDSITKKISKKIDDSDDDEGGNNDDENVSPSRKKIVKKTFLSDSEFFNRMQQKLDLTDSERNLAIKNSLNTSKIVRDNNLCSLTNEKMEVNASCVSRISITRVVPTVLEPVRVCIENLVHWLQVSMCQRDELNVWISDIVCDFIRDEDEKWWFIQLKGFKYDVSCIERVQKWYFCKQAGEPIIKTAKRPEEVREKLEKERGSKCQLCGLNFQDYMVISIERSGAEADDVKHDLHDAALFDKSHNKHAGEGKYRDVPAFGYQLTAKKSCSLACVYRDAKKPLTKYSRDILAAYAVTLDARSAAPSFSEEAQINAKKNRHTSCICCYYCFQIVEEQEKFEELCFSINSLLGINAKPVDSGELQNENSDSPKKVSPKKVKADSDDFEYNAKIMSERVKEILNWSSIKHKKKDTDYLKTDIKFFNDDLMLHKEKKAKVTLSNINTSENISETEGGFALGTWKAQNFKRGTSHIRLIVMAHYMTDFDLPKNHNLQGTLGCIGYSLGTSIQAMCFSTKVDEEFESDQVVWIKQARVHYFCGNVLDVKHYFSDRYIEFHLYSLYPDNSHGHSHSHSNSHSNSHSHSHSHAHNEPQPHPQLTTTFRVSLNRLNWSGNASKDGSEKIEFDIPIHIKGAFKEANLRLSVAIKVDDLLPDLDSVMRFVKEEELFWPTDDYYPVLPLPDPWIAMLTTNQSLRSERGEEVIVDGEAADIALENNQDHQDNDEDKGDNIFDEQENDAKATKDILKFIETEFYNDVNENNNEEGEISNSSVSMQMNVHKILNNIKMKTKRERIKEMATPKFLLNAITEDENEVNEVNNNKNFLDDDDNNNNFENLKEYISLYPFVDRILQLLREESARIDSSDMPNSNSFVEAIRVLSMSIEQILHQEDLPSYVNWVFFKELMDECIPWAKVQRTRVKLALESKDNTNNDARAVKTSAKASITKSAGVIENHKKNRELLIHDLQVSHQKTQLDVLFCVDDDFGARKYRRMTLALTIFDLASNCDDKVDIKTLHKFLEMQRRRLDKIITLFNDGAMTIPSVSKAVTDELSLVHILYSTVLLCASSTLSSLLDTYHNEGVTIISRIGFLSIAEETFDAVTRNAFNPSETLASFLNIATFHVITRQTERRATRVVSKLNNDVRRSSIIMGNSPISSPLSSFATNMNIARKIKDVTPFIFLCCDFHGNENFYLGDIYCTTCAKDDKVEFDTNNRI